MSASDQLGFMFIPTARRTWTVHDLVAAVRTRIEREYGDIWVEGEISNFRALRESNLRLLGSVPRARWVECYGVHELRGRQTVEEFIRLEAAHDLDHLRQIDRILSGA